MPDDGCCHLCFWPQLVGSTHFTHRRALVPHRIVCLPSLAHARLGRTPAASRQPPAPRAESNGERPRTRNNHPSGQAATVAGYAGPGFHTWPTGHTPQDTDPNPLLRSRSTAQKSFGETFGAATGVSDPRLQKTRIRNAYPGGQAATVAGHAGPGFHNWPQSHTPQNTNPKPPARSRSAGHPIAETQSFIRQPSDTCGWLTSSHAELGLSAPGNAEPQLGECFQNSAKAT